MSQRIRVAVVFGGQSGEHAISCISAASVLRALDRDRYEVVPVGILPDGRWLLAPDDPAALEPAGSRLPQAPADGAELAVVPGGYRLLDRSAQVEASTSLSRVDVVFPLLHGPWGEDGTLQGLLELARVPYVGSGVFASAAAMDKQHMKALLAQAGLTVGPYEVLRPGDPVRAPGEGPWFVKPARAGSSLGITMVHERDGLAAAVQAARLHDPKVLVEAAVTGREVECGVLGGTPPRASLPAEIRVHAGREFYDFEAKYLPGQDGATAFDIPADLSPELTRAVQALALRAFAALDCAGLARVDFFLTGPGPNDIVINELNTMPGFTPLSMYPQMWAASGLAYPALLDALLADALRRGTGLR